MKVNRSTYFSIGFLFLFLSSFSTNVYSSFGSDSKTDSHYSKNNEVKQCASSSATENLVFEETKNDCEDGFELQSFVLPFFISSFQLEVSNPHIVSAQPLAEKLTNPIYIAVCNFRI